MDKKKDLRIIRTDKTLVNAFYDLLRTNPVEDISISLLCDNALVNRATFYKHFTDKRNFLDFCIAFKIREIRKANAIEEAQNVTQFFTDRLFEVFTLFANIEKLNPVNIEYSGRNLKIFAESADRIMSDAFREYYSEYPVNAASSIDMLSAGQSGALIGIVCEYIRTKEGNFDEEKYKAIIDGMRSYMNCN